MYTKNVENTLKNRREIEKGILSVTNVGLVGLADYFEVSLSSIKKDLKDMGKDVSEYEKNHSGQKTIEQLKRQRKREIEKRLKTESPETVLESLGLWRMPSDVNKSLLKIEISEDFPSDRAKLVRRAANMIERGIGTEEVAKYLGITKVEKVYLKSQNLGVNKGFDSKDESVAQGYVKDGDTPENVSQLTGYSKTKLNFVEKGYDVEKHYKYSKKSEKNAEKEALKEEAYRRYLAGERQQTIADDYGVTRETIVNWMEEKKFEHLDEREATGEGVYYRRRNTEKTEKNGSYDKGIHTIPQKDVKETEYAAKKALGMGMMHHFGRGPQAGTVNIMSATDHAKLVNKQHFNKAVHKMDPARMKNAVTFGSYESYLDEKGLIEK